MRAIYNDGDIHADDPDDSWLVSVTRDAEFTTLVVGNQTISAFEPGVYDLRDYVFDESGSLDNDAELIVGIQECDDEECDEPTSYIATVGTLEIVRVDEESAERLRSD